MSTGTAAVRVLLRLSILCVKPAGNSIVSNAAFDRRMEAIRRPRMRHNPGRREARELWQGKGGSLRRQAVVGVMWSYAT
jgi:hypothetical protein